MIINVSINNRKKSNGSLYLSSNKSMCADVECLSLSGTSLPCSCPDKPHSKKMIKTKSLEQESLNNQNKSGLQPGAHSKL